MSAINTPYATLSFANIFTPRPRAEGGTPVYSCSLIFDPSQQKSPPTKPCKTPASPPPARSGATTCSSRASTCRSATRARRATTAITPVIPSFQPWSKNKPGVVDTNRQDILVPDEVWSGQLVRANVVPFAWTHTGRKGVSLRPEPSPDHPVRRAAAPRRTSVALFTPSMTAKSKRKRSSVLMATITNAPTRATCSPTRSSLSTRGGPSTTTQHLEQNFREAAAVASVIIGQGNHAARRRDGSWPASNWSGPRVPRTSSTTTLTA